MFLRKEYENLGKDFIYKKEFCTMKKLTPICRLNRKSGVGYKYPKLSEACEFFGVTDTEIKADVKRFFADEKDFHDARFDTTALYLIANYGMEKGLEELKEYL
jgi:DNA polymerase-3 subunit epsilon